MWKIPNSMLGNQGQDALPNLASLKLPACVKPLPPANCYLSLCLIPYLQETFPAAAEQGIRMWFLPSKISYSKCLVLHLGLKYPRAFPTGCGKDF